MSATCPHHVRWFRFCRDCARVPGFFPPGPGDDAAFMLGMIERSYRMIVHLEEMCGLPTPTLWLPDEDEWQRFRRLKRLERGL